MFIWLRFCIISLTNPLLHGAGHSLDCRKFYSYLLLFTVSLIPFLAACSTHNASIPIRLDDNLAQGEVIWSRPTELAPRFVVGFDRRLEPQEDVKIYAPLLIYLERETGYHFDLHITPRNSTLAEEISKGTVDFAIAGVLSYLQAHEQSGARVLVRGVNRRGQSVYRAAIVTRADSPISSLDDLRGRTFAFGAASSTQGYLIPRLLLNEAGLSLSDIGPYEFTGSHIATSDAVISGRADAGGLQDTLASELTNQGLLKVIAWSDFYPSSGVTAGGHVPEDAVASVQSALLAFDPNTVTELELYHWDRTEMPGGFSLANDELYAGLRQLAEQYGLIGT